MNAKPQSGVTRIDVPSTAGSSIVFDAGTSAGTDTLWARLLQNDGSSASWQQFTVTVPPPTLTVHNASGATPGRQIPFSTLVTISYPQRRFRF
ncbi:MAG: hypothetical protein WAV78_19940 [Xanthobacteraceae bacterium]